MKEHTFILAAFLLLTSCSVTNITGKIWKAPNCNSLDNIVFKKDGTMIYDLPSVNVYNIKTTYKIDTDSNGILIGNFHYDLKLKGNEIEICSYKYYN